MTLPQLYSHVSLRSYDYVRYCRRDGRPEGCGMASPFSMGLNGLVSRNVAGYVRSFELCGEWKEHELQEYAKMGRVPDESMLLNTLVRVAVERMGVLDSFTYAYQSPKSHHMLTMPSWRLNTKMLPTVWQGLSQKMSLRKLTVRFPSVRHPRPITLVPPIPNLEYLHMYDIDPLCYADDISLLLLGSKKLRDLKLHWSPRMREAREPSIHKAAYFRRCVAANYQAPLRSIAIQNLYANHDSECGNVIDISHLRELTFLNSTGGANDDGATAFMDGTWRKPDEALPPKLKMFRADKVSHQQCEFLSTITGLEKLYLIGPHSRARNDSSKDLSTSNGTTAPPLPNSPVSSNTSSPSATDINTITSLKSPYISAITKNHGATLTHLLLLPQWRLTDDDIAIIVRQCPKLQQLGLGVEFASFDHLRLLVPFLANLTSIRLLGNPDDPSFVNMMREMDEKGTHEEKIGEDTANQEWSRLRYMELGAEDLIFEIGKREVVGEYRSEGGWGKCGGSGGGGKKSVWRRAVKKRGWEAVRDIEIWRMDSLDL